MTAGARQEQAVFEVDLLGCLHSILVYASRLRLPNTASVNVTLLVFRKNCRGGLGIVQRRKGFFEYSV
jgi:hypothetical protein